MSNDKINSIATSLASIAKIQEQTLVEITKLNEREDARAGIALVWLSGILIYYLGSKIWVSFRDQDKEEKSQTKEKQKKS